MFFSKDETEVRKLVAFYSIYTSIYFPILILALLWTDGIYLTGKYKFNLVIMVIVIAELVKYFSSAVYSKTNDLNLSKKYEERSGSSLVRNIFTRTKIREGFKNTVTVLFMIFVYSGIAILYGAEIFSKYEETFMFSSLLSVLTIFPACVNLGCQSIVALLFGGKPINKLETLIHQNLYLTVLGAWLGAFVIPLDWDRPWQVWPIPCSFGAMIGFTLSHFVMMFKVSVGGPRKKMKRNF